MATLYLKSETDVLFKEPELKTKIKHLLWGDSVYILDFNTAVKDVYTVKARGFYGYIHQCNSLFFGMDSNWIACRIDSNSQLWNVVIFPFGPYQIS